MYIIYAVWASPDVIFVCVLFDDRHDDMEIYLQYPLLLV